MSTGKKDRYYFLVLVKKQELLVKVSGGKPSNSDPQQAHFELKTQNGQTYGVIIPVNIINQIPGAGSLLNINNKQVRIINVQPRKSSDSKQEIKIEEPSQIKLMTDSLVKITQMYQRNFHQYSIDLNQVNIQTSDTN